MLEACLRLFKAIPMQLIDQQQVRFDLAHGLVYFAPVSDEDEKELFKAINKVFPDYSGFKATFYPTWAEVSAKTEADILRDQVLHYFSTYGMENLFGECGRVAIPNEVITSGHANIEVFTVGVLSEEELKNKISTMLFSSVAYSYQDIQDVFMIAEKFLGKEWLRNLDSRKIMNRELRIYYFAKTDRQPTDPTEIMRLLSFQVNGKTTLINERVFGCFSKEEQERVNAILWNCQDELATVFYRYKKFLVSLKHLGNSEICKTINLIRKKARTAWKPRTEQPTFVTTKILRGEFPESEINKLSLVQLIKVHNRLASYKYQIEKYGKAYNFYPIRNHKMAVDLEPKIYIPDNLEYNILLLKIRICQRFENNPNKIIPYMPDSDIDYAVPTTTKSFLGDIPLWSRKKVGSANTVGIHWNKNDIDLSMILNGKKIGWNGYWNNEGRSMYSGDMTRAICTNPDCGNFKGTRGQDKGVCPICKEPLHASEAIYFGSERGLVDVSLYNCRDAVFDICFAKDAATKGYVMDKPKDAVRVQQDFGTAIVGMTYSLEEGNAFVFTCLDSGQSNVAYYDATTEPLMQVIESYGETSFKMSDLYDGVRLYLVDEGKTWRKVERFTKADFIELVTEQPVNKTNCNINII